MPVREECMRGCYYRTYNALLVQLQMYAYGCCQSYGLNQLDWGSCEFGMMLLGYHLC